MDSDGSNPIRIADETLANGPQCSPDGKWVVYLRGPSWAPLRVHIRGGPPQVITKDLVAAGYTALSLAQFSVFCRDLPGRKINRVSHPARLSGRKSRISFCFQTKSTEGNPFRRRRPVVPVRLAAVSQ